VTDNDTRISKEALFEVINFLATDLRAPTQIGRPTGDSNPSWLNPQPLPPMPASISPAEPWKAPAVSRYVIRMTAMARAAATNEEDGMRAARAVMNAFIDDFCGTVPGSDFKLPSGWPRIDVKPSGLDVLVAAARFHAAASTMPDDPMGSEFAAASDRLLGVGMQKLGAK